MHPVPIDSLDDARVADYRNVRDGALRAERGLFVVEGRLCVRALLEHSRFRVRSVFVTPVALEAMQDAFARLDGSQHVYVAPQAVLSRVVGYDLHRGCLAVAERRAPEPLDALLATAGQTSLLVVLEQLTNADNVGGVFRNAAAFGADGVVLCPRCCDPLYRKAVRVSMGSTLRVPFARCRAWPEDVERLRAAGYALVALHPRAGTADVGALERALAGARRVALLLGSEGPGLSDAALAAADLRVRIPLAPGVDSLNVSTACAIALHRLAGRAQEDVL